MRTPLRRDDGFCAGLRCRSHQRNRRSVGLCDSLHATRHCGRHGDLDPYHVRVGAALAATAGACASAPARVLGARSCFRSPAKAAAMAQWHRVTAAAPGARLTTGDRAADTGALERGARRRRWCVRDTGRHTCGDRAWTGPGIPVRRVAFCRGLGDRSSLTPGRGPRSQSAAGPVREDARAAFVAPVLAPSRTARLDATIAGRRRRERQRAAPTTACRLPSLHVVVLLDPHAARSASSVARADTHPTIFGSRVRDRTASLAPMGHTNEGSSRAEARTVGDTP
jgi:hypothetical protein